MALSYYTFLRTIYRFLLVCALSVIASAAHAIPASPTNVSAMSSGGYAYISWSPVGGATSYRVQKAYGREAPLTTTATQITDISVTLGNTYTYWVSACDSGGCSGQASSNAVTIVAGPPPPTAPASMTATQNGAAVSLSWPASANAISYKLKRTNGSTVIALPDVSTTSATDSSVAVDTDYIYQVQACNSGGCSSGWTSSTTIRISHIPSPPSSVNALVRQDAIYVSWPNTDNASSFKLTRNGSQISAAATSPYADASVVNGTSYTYGVSACNNTGCSSVVFSAAVVAGAVQAGVKVVEGYDYNVLGRLIKVKQDGSTKTQYDYDNAGNRKQVNE